MRIRIPTRIAVCGLLNVVSVISLSFRLIFFVFFSDGVLKIRIYCGTNYNIFGYVRHYYKNRAFMQFYEVKLMGFILLYNKIEM